MKKQCIFSVIIGSLFGVMAVASTQSSERIINDVLTRYKDYLDYGVNSVSSVQRMHNKPKSRYHTFKQAFEYFNAHHGKVIVELGTSRSFVDGAFPGCCSDDPQYWEPTKSERWDWGAGFFTRVALECLGHLKPEFHTVDIETGAINRCKVMTHDFKNIIKYHVCSSEEFLKSCKPKSIDLLYLDTGCIDHETALLHFREAKIIVERNVLSNEGIILIDDVKNLLPNDDSGFGKAKYSLPYFLAHGYEMVADEYQVILKRKK